MCIYIRVSYPVEMDFIPPKSFVRTLRLTEFMTSVWRFINSRSYNGLENDSKIFTKSSLRSCILSNIHFVCNVFIVNLLANAISAWSIVSLREKKLCLVLIIAHRQHFLAKKRPKAMPTSLENFCPGQFSLPSEWSSCNCEDARKLSWQISFVSSVSCVCVCVFFSQFFNHFSYIFIVDPATSCIKTLRNYLF